MISPTINGWLKTSIINKIIKLGDNEISSWIDEFNNIRFKLVNKEIVTVFIIPSKYSRFLKGELCNHNIIILLNKFNLTYDPIFLTKTIKENKGHGRVYSFNAPHKCIKVIYTYYLSRCVEEQLTRSINKNIKTILKNELSVIKLSYNILNTIFNISKSSMRKTFIELNKGNFSQTMRTIRKKIGAN